MHHDLSKGATVTVLNRVFDCRRHLAVLLLPLLVYLALACYHIDSQSLWLDEVYSIRDASSPERFLKKTHGPVYFVLLHLWMKVGTSEQTLRLLSVLIGVAALCLFYAMSLTLTNRRVTILGTTIFATSPFLIWYSQEVRYITLMLATSLFAMYSFQRSLARDRRGCWTVYSVAMTLAIATFVTNVFLLLAQGLYLIFSPPNRPLLRKWIVCQVLIGSLFVWWFSERIFHRTSVETSVGVQEVASVRPKQLRSGSQKEFSSLMLPYTFLTFSAGFSQGPSLQELHVSRSLSTLRPHTPVLIILSGLFGGILVVGLTTLRHDPEAGKLLMLWTAVPVLSVLAISASTNLSYNVRYAAMALPAYILILAVGIARFRRPVVQVSLLLVILLSNGISLANYYHNPHYAREDARAAVAYLTSVVQPSDLILVIGHPHVLQYYAKDNLTMLSVNDLPNMDQPVSDRLESLQQPLDRLWIVEIRAWKKAGKVRAALDQAYHLIEHKQLPGVDIYTYVYRPQNPLQPQTSSGHSPRT